MKTIGIIAEYNPFHNGHAYQIEEIRRKTGADFILIAMSGDFVQRGAPAIIDKHTRAHMALLGGADLVLELPALWATASAEDFAAAGVALLEKTGCVDGICFGCETDNFALLSVLADILADEPEAFRTTLNLSIKKGASFPKARAAALSYVCGGLPDAQAVPALLAAPNNILALEYLKALRRRCSPITPWPLRREGADYHDTAIRDGLHPTASATAIRSAIHTGSVDSSVIKKTMPRPVYDILNKYLKTRPAMNADDFSSILGYLLLTEQPAGLHAVGGSSPELANRLWKNRYHFQSFSQFCHYNKSRDITYARISRVLTHLILKIGSRDYTHGRDTDYITSLRILGFRKEAAPLLSRLKKTAAVPVIAKLADASGQVAEAYLSAGELYRQVQSAKAALLHTDTVPGQISCSEYRKKIVIL